MEIQLTLPTEPLLGSSGPLQARSVLHRGSQRSCLPGEGQQRVRIANKPEVTSREQEFPGHAEVRTDRGGPGSVLTQASPSRLHTAIVKGAQRGGKRSWKGN